MQDDKMTDVLREKLWKEFLKKSVEGEGDEKKRELFDCVYEQAQNHLFDAMKDIFENDIELFLEFFE